MRSIPKDIEAHIFRTISAWRWRTMRKSPNMPVHLITADQSHFYKQGLPDVANRLSLILNEIILQMEGLFLSRRTGIQICL